MKIWVDAQLPATLANWLFITFGLEAAALRDLSLRDAQDMEIFEAARAENAVIMTKDSDFIDLVCRLGGPPQILWLKLTQELKDELLPGSQTDMRCLRVSHVNRKFLIGRDCDLV